MLKKHCTFIISQMLKKTLHFPQFGFFYITQFPWALGMSKNNIGATRRMVVKLDLLLHAWQGFRCFMVPNFQSWGSCAVIVNFSYCCILTLKVPCISESYIEIKIKSNFYFHTSLWCLKRFYEGLYEGLHKTFWGTATKKSENKNLT